MIACRRNNLAYFQFHLLAGYPGLRHGVFTRLGGHSPPPYDSLNMGRNGDDPPGNVEANRRLAAGCLADGWPLVSARQVHGRTVASLRRAEHGSASFCRGPEMTADALVTDIPGLLLSIQLADCQAVVLYDPVREVVANVHSGWRGSTQNIAAAAVRRMEADFACRPADIRAGVSPSLGPCCAEFRNYRTEIPEELWGYGNGRLHFNFWEITRDQLTAAGIAPAHIEVAGICTRCNEHLFYSYRKHSKTGRFAAVAGLAVS
jgi:YfiH family protein